MRLIKYTSFFVTAMVLSVFGTLVQAENTKEYDKHIVYVNAFPTDSLPPQMTKQYGLKRSKNYAMVNVSVMEKGAGVPTGVKSNVSGYLKNLMGQGRDLEFREIKEGKAVYYIAQVGVQSREVVHFYINIMPDGGSEEYAITFDKKF